MRPGRTGRSENVRKRPESARISASLVSLEGFLFPQFGIWEATKQKLVMKDACFKVQYYKCPFRSFPLKSLERRNDAQPETPNNTETSTLKSQANCSWTHKFKIFQNDAAGGGIASSANIHVTIRCIFSNLESISLMVYPIFQYYKIIGIQCLI